MIIETMTPYKKSEKLDIFVRGHLIVALLWLIRGAGCVLNSEAIELYLKT